MPVYYPVNLSIKGKRCLVIGAGNVAERKVRGLLGSAAHVSVISPDITPGLKVLWKNKKISFMRKHFSLKDLSRAYLVISATDDRKVNSAVSDYCRRKGVLVNIVDSPDECSFMLPSVLRRGGLAISISTDGVSPSLSKIIRKELENKYGSEYAELLRMIKKVRPQVLKKIKNIAARKCFYKKVYSGAVLDLIRRGRKRGAKIKMERILEDAIIS